MNDPMGHVCPECGAPRGADNTPSCACAERAADAHLENRTAEAAAAEDFDPLRIRPYVELTPETPGSPTSPTSPGSPGHLTADPAAEATMPMRAVPETGRPDEAATAAIPAVGPPDSAPGLLAEDEPPTGSGSRPRVLLLGAAGAVLVILAAGGLAGGMFTYDKPARDNTAAQEVRESVPAATTSAAAPPTPSASPTPSKPAPKQPAPAPAPSPSPTPSPTLTAPSPTPSESATPTQAPSTAAATGTITPAPGGGARDTVPVLRPGDHGNEVLELQLRLRQLAIYLGETDGVYDDNVENAVSTYQTTRGIETEESGVYDRTTRERLESETTQP
ncbi:peptidoglycan-binding domain-containing protein [Streptomyces sp. NRRL WC-3618]|uniref:peptidoglycan-binding domain-containing protein n=1 Tax=Streptomyces sp. NRRL WC-3618 TaxID=1519490 RepID=UPI0006ADB600|nr:peptidoglycan-binding protein [Streptomyces sp. NRRL WC-3618]